MLGPKSSAGITLGAPLQETNQEVPGWLQGIASRAPQYGGKNRRGGGNRFGGRDFRRDAGAGGCESSAWVHSCFMDLSCSLSVRSSFWWT